jgi:hypothetical protein
MKSTLYITATVLEGNKIEIQTPNLPIGQSVEVIVLVPDTNYSSEQGQSLSLEQRIAFLKLPISERRRILQVQAESMVTHYEQNSEWKEFMAGDIVDY